MADGLQLNAGSGGATLATDDAGAAGHVQVVKLAISADGSATAIPADAANGIDVDVTRVGGTVTVDGSGVTQPVSHAALTELAAAINSSQVDVNIAAQAGALTVASHAVTNAGTFAVQVDGAVLTSLQLIDDAVVADDAAFTAATTKVVMAGFVADEGSTDSVTEDDAGAARMTLDRKQIVTPYAHAAAGGATPYKNLDCDETEDEIKGTPGKLFWVHAMNLSNAKRYLKLYNDTAANVSVGTTVPVLTFPIPTHADTNGAGFTISFGDIGVQFSAAITVAATTGFADNDTGAPGANEVILNAGYL